MDIEITYYNRILFQFEDAMNDIEKSVADMKRWFNDLLRMYHKMRLSNMPRDEVFQAQVKMLQSKEAIDRTAMELKRVEDTHRQMVHMIETTHAKG